MSSRWGLMKQRDRERLQMAVATEQKALEEQRETQARQCKGREADKVCKFCGAELEESLKIIQTRISGLMGLCRGLQPCVCQSLEHWDCAAQSHHQGC